MAAASFLRSIFLKHFVKPVCERTIFRSISSIKPQRIVEVGLDTVDRAVDLIELAQRHRPTVDIRYTGLDMFDARVAGEKLSLKDAHSILKPTTASIQLIPGDPLSSLSRVANNLASTDLLIISASHESAPAEPEWYFIPRMLHDHSVVFYQAEPEQAYTRLTFKEVTLKAESESSRANTARKAA